MLNKVARIAFLACGAAGCGCASQLIVNGGFETGTLSGWTLSSEAGSYAGSDFFASKSTTTPISGSATSGAESGTYYAVSDGVGPATEVLSQTFTVPTGLSSVVLSYSLFVDSASGDVIDTAAGLDYSQGANQYADVSLLSSGTSVFSTSSGVLRDFYQGTDNAAPIPNAYTNYSFNITSLVSAGGTFTLRFAEVDNLGPLNMGIDNVSIVTTAVTPTPEPDSVTLGFLSMIAFSALLLIRNNAARRRQPSPAPEATWSA